MSKFQAYGDNRHIIICKRTLLAQIFGIMAACKQLAVNMPFTEEEIAARYTSEAETHVSNLPDEEIDKLLEIAIQETTEIKHKVLPDEQFCAYAFEIALQMLAGKSHLSIQEWREEITETVNKHRNQCQALKDKEKHAIRD